MCSVAPKKKTKKPFRLTIISRVFGDQLLFLMTIKPSACSDAFSPLLPWELNPFTFPHRLKTRVPVHLNISNEALIVFFVETQKKKNQH